MKKLLIFPSLLLVYFIYYLTLGRTVLPLGDSGELVTTAFFGGIAHPPGYPLYNLIGHLFLKLPIREEVAFRLNLLSAVFHVAALYFFYRTCLLLSNNKYILSVVCTLILAFSYSFWLYSLVAEVFSLHDLFYCLLVYILIKIAQCRKKELIARRAAIWSFIFGLAMANNHIIALLAPVFIYALIKKNNQFNIYSTVKARIIIGTKLLAISFFGLTPYLYFFWARNNVNPASWMYPQKLEDVINHFFRFNYGGLMQYHDVSFVLLNLKSVFINLFACLFNLWHEFWLFSIAGFLFIWLFIFFRKQLIIKILLMLFLMNLFFISVVRYDIENYSFSIFERLYLNFNIIFAAALLLVFSSLHSLLRFNKLYLRLFYLIISLIAFFIFAIHYKQVDQSRNTLCRSYFKDVERSIPPNSLVFIEGDQLTFCFLYYEYVLKNIENKDNRIYFFSSYLNANNQSRYIKARNGLDFQKAKNYYDIIEKIKKNKSIFTIGINLGDGYQVRPLGIINKIEFNEKNDYQAIYQNNFLWFKESIFLKDYFRKANHTLGDKSMKEFYCSEYLNTVQYLLDKKQSSYAKKTFNNLEKQCTDSDFSTRWARAKSYRNKF